MRQTLPRYPVYVISKGRAGQCRTAQALLEDGCPFRVVIEPQELEEYAKHLSRDLLLVLPFSNLGLGSIPARNWVWSHAKEAGHRRHWILDDNMTHFDRRYRAMRIRCEAGVALYHAEVFVDRYANIAVAGLNYEMFVPEGVKMPPYVPNVHVYSCLLIDCDLEQRWRGRYNEDTDLCLQVLSAGLCTVLFNAFLVKKITTGVMKGGNADELYKGDGRLTMARSLERLWPGIVQTKRRFGRPQHVVNWRKFDTPLERRTDIDWDSLEPPPPMRLKAVREVKAAGMRKLLQEHGGE